MMYAVIDEKEGKEDHWKKRAKIDRETDPVLNWLTAARHVASHVAAFQIQKITGPSKLSISLIPENSQNLADARELFAVIPPTMITPNSLPPWIKGSKVMVDPPEYHFGKSLKSDLNCNQLWDITDLALNYLEGMITEAENISPLGLNLKHQQLNIDYQNLEDTALIHQPRGHNIAPCSTRRMTGECGSSSSTP